MKKSFLHLATLVYITLAAILTVLQQYGYILLPPPTAVVARWEGESNPQPETGLVETTNSELIQDQPEQDRERELV